MSGTEKSDTKESLISLLEENEKRVNTLANKLEENSDLFRVLLSFLEENQKRMDGLTKKIDIIEQKQRGPPNEIPKKTDSSPMKIFASRNILVVDDDKKLATSLKLILENEGYIVDLAHNGFSAHIKITRNTYDLVILDWHLGDLIGDQIAETIEKRHSETKIIFITGYSYVLDEFDRKNEIMLKPIEPDHILETVAKLLSNEQVIRV